MANGLTENEKRVLRFIYGHGRPTYREIVKGVGLSDVTSAVYVVNSLIKKNLLKKQKGISRSLEITKDGYLHLHTIVIHDLIGWLETDIKFSSPQELKVSEVTNAPLQQDTNYWPSAASGKTESQNMPDIIKATASLLSSCSSTNISENIKNTKKFIPLFFAAGMGSTFCLAIILSLIVLPSSLLFLREDWMFGFLIISSPVILSRPFNTKK